MALFNDIYCLLCDRFIAKKQWNKPLYSSGNLHREVNGFWSAYFPQKKLTRHEGIVLERAFWEMNFGSDDVLHVYRFLKTYILMATKRKDYVTLDPVVDDADYRKEYRDTIVAQFKEDIYNKNFSLQDRNKHDQIEALENRIAFWLKIIDDTGVPIPDEIYNYD